MGRFAASDRSSDELNEVLVRLDSLEAKLFERKEDDDRSVAAGPGKEKA